MSRSIPLYPPLEKTKPMLPQGFPAADIEAVSSGAAPVVSDPDVIVTNITSGDTGGTEIVTLADGTTLDQRKVIVLFRRQQVLDLISIRPANLKSEFEKVELTGTDHFVELRWDGDNWEIVQMHSRVEVENV